MKFYMISLGCAKNTVDSERMIYLLQQGGHTMTNDPTEADVAIINSCGFIQDANEEFIEVMTDMVAMRDMGYLKMIAVTGCLAERHQRKLAVSFPEVDAVFGIGEEVNVCAIMEELQRRMALRDADEELHEEDFDEEDFDEADFDDEAYWEEPEDQLCRFSSKDSLPLTGGRTLLTPSHYAYLKIAEGCSNCCSYCTIPSIRGKFRSVPMEDVLAEANTLVAQGVKELIVVAQDTTRYGEDIYGEARLPQLLRALCAIPDVHWVRVLYCYPERVTDELIDVLAEEPKMTKYLDIPIQHCNGEILKAMNRQGDKASLTALIQKLRARIPDITLRTTLMTGFPSETEEQFQELAEFAAEMQFDWVGCFAYSKEKGTPAASFPAQVWEDERMKRAEILRCQSEVLHERKADELMGTTLEVVADEYDDLGECWVCRTAAMVPEVDGCVFVDAARDAVTPGTFFKTRIYVAIGNNLKGEVVTDEPAE